MSLPPGAAVRAEAAGILAEVMDEGRSLKAVLAQRLPAISDTRDRALVEAICFTALRHRRRYEAMLRTWMHQPMPTRSRIDRRVSCLWLVGLAQIDGLRLPAHAAVAATVEAVRVLGRPGWVGVFNAVLRRADREHPWPMPAAPAERFSLPDWLWDQFTRDWPDAAVSIAEQGNAEAPLWLRANPEQVGRDGLAGQLADAGIEATHGIASHSLKLSARADPIRLPGFDAGAFTVQDLAAQLAVEALAVEPGARVLDACAAPGGKTAQLAAAVGSNGRVIALDVDARRLTRVDGLLRRLGLGDGRVVTRSADAIDVSTWHDGELFDAILLDAPCSATGILRRQPDARWHRRAEDLPSLLRAQSRLLDALWPLLRPGGRLLYATCSVLRDENDRQIAAFLDRTPDARLRPLAAHFGRALATGSQRFPGENGGDGFFYALMERT